MYAGTPINLSTTYTTLRTLSAAVSDSTPPVAGSFTVSIQPTTFADVLIIGSAVGGTVTPTSITWKIWRLVGSIIEQVDEYNMLASDIAVPVTRTAPNGTDKLWITATLNGGTSPTVSAVVSIRALMNGGITQSKLSVDSLGNLKTKPAGYDSLTDSQKTVVLNELNPPLDEIAVISETSRTAGTTYYWSSDTGLDMLSYDTLCMQLSITGAGASIATVTVEGTINGTTWHDVTLNVFDETVKAYLAGAAVTSSGGNLNVLWSLYNVTYSKVRVKVVITVANTGAVSASFRRSKLGAK